MVCAFFFLLVVDHQLMENMGMVGQPVEIGGMVDLQIVHVAL